MNDRKRQVLLTAQQLFIEKGFATTSVQDILKESGISKGTFYNYFSSKNECLIAILEHAQETSNVKQRDLLIGQDITDKSILAKQITTRLQMNQGQNLIILFEAVFHSKEQELRDFVKKHYLSELMWLTNRIIDVYGKEVRPYAFDCAAMLFGMLQHIIQIWTIDSKDKVIETKPVHFIIKRLDAIINDMVQSKDVLLGGDIYHHLKLNVEQKPITKKEVYTQLSGFKKRLEIKIPNGEEYIQFLLEELETKQPRAYLLETISRSFVEAYRGTSDEAEAQEITSKLWKYIDDLP